MIRPVFYDDFTCIADKCDFTCCQEWKIGVDDATAAKWKKANPPKNHKTRRKNLEQFTQYKDGQRVIALEKHVCPFLSEQKLCSLVCQFGDSILPETCQVFPREIHKFEDRTEAVLMPCCPEAIDLLNQAEGFELTEQVSASDRLVSIRQELMKLLARDTVSSSIGILAGYYILQELFSKDTISIEEAFSYGDEIIHIIKEMSFEPGEHFVECNELFLDLTDNYRRQEIYGDYLNPLVELAERISGLSEPDEYSEAFLQKWLEHEKLIHKLLVQEIFADLINADSELEDALIRYQWIAMEYALLKHLSFLHYSLKQELDYKSIRDCIVLASRMMGYEQEDIYEYMENSFEEMIWDWGYMALLIGK